MQGAKAEVSPGISVAVACFRSCSGLLSSVTFFHCFRHVEDCSARADEW